MATQAASRRDFFKLAGAGGAAVVGGAGLSSRAWARSATPVMGSPGGKRVVVIGGGYGGNFVAVALRTLAPDAEVVVIERHPFFVSGPASIEYVFGLASLDEITRGYRALMAQGINVVKAEVEAVEPDRKRVHTSAGYLDYDYLVVAAGIRLAYEEIAGLKENMWVNAHPYDKSSIVDLRQRIDAFRGGNVVVGVPPGPYKCPPGPYEFVLLFADYIKKKGLKGKVITLDAAGSPFAPLAKGFQEAMEFTFADQVEYIPFNNVVSVDPRTKSVTTGKNQTYKYDLLCLIPPNRTALFIKDAGLGNPWIEVDPLTFRSLKHERIYAVGDNAKYPYPKSAYSASMCAKACAHAIAEATGARVPPRPGIHNICYPYISADKAMLIRVDFSVADGKVKGTPSKDEVGSKNYVRLRKVWERGLWREMFGA